MATTEEESSKLLEFRERVHAIYPECDEVLLTWLRARDLQVDKAEQMLRRHLIWRRNNEIPELRSWKSPKNFFPYVHTGFDLESHPIFILPIGRWDFRLVIEAGDMVPSLKYVYQLLESALTAAKAKGSILICDFDGFGYRQLAHRTVVQGMIEVMRVFEANYPECLRTAYVINAPKVFHVLFSLIKPLMNSRTLSKIKIFGPDREKWQANLLKIIPAEVLPPHWGGSLAGADEFCSDRWFAHRLPPYFMRKLSATMDEYGEEWFAVKVEAGDKLTLDYYIDPAAEDMKESCFELKWRFKTDGYDIGFSVAKSSAPSNSESDDEEILVPYSRVDSQLQIVEGAMDLTSEGKYSVIFDNSYSRSRAKTLHCTISFISDKDRFSGNNNINNNVSA